MLRSYVDFRETTREAESYEKYRAPLLGWWEALTEGFRRCRLVVERIQQRLDDVAAWLAQSVASNARRGRGLSRRSIFDGADLCGDQEMEAEALCPAEGTEERDTLCP